MTGQRYRLVVAYDGTDFAGWQIQPEQRTVQEEIEKALLRMTGTPVRVHSSSRTDAGVHARGMAAHLDLPLDIPARGLKCALNGMIPPDIRILRTDRVPSDFHARFDAAGKEYRYFICNREILPPFLRNYRLHCRRPLQIERMRQGAALLTGTHDFSAFTANSGVPLKDAVREVSEFEIRKRGSEIMLRVYGAGFLYKMVRSMVGFLVRVGMGEMEPEAAVSILKSRTRTKEVPSAQAQGLFLWKVDYRTSKSQTSGR